MFIKRPFICTEVGITQNFLDSVCAVIEGEILYSDIKQSKKTQENKLKGALLLIGLFIYHNSLSSRLCLQVYQCNFVNFVNNKHFKIECTTYYHMTRMALQALSLQNH